MADDHLFELRIDVCDGTSLFSNEVYVGYPNFAEAVSQLDRFKDHIHFGVLDMQFCAFGPECGSGGFHARFHFAQPGRLYITCRQQSRFEDFGCKNVASEATLYLKTEPVLLDNFIEQLKALEAKNRDDAYLETI